MGKNKKLLFNTAILYIRKIVNILLGFFSTRLLLQYLGVDDFGLYGLLGSVVAMFNSLRGVFATSIQRFINIERGNHSHNDEATKNRKVNKIFSIGVYVHFLIGLIFLALVNAGGFIMLRYLNIGPDNYVTAVIIMECAILSAVVAIFTVPYDALIVSHERFNAYAIFSVVESVLRLGAVLFLALCSYRVIVYSLLMLITSMIIMAINWLYCRKQFPIQSKYKRVHDKQLLRSMTKFAGWQFFGDTGFTISNQGVNFVLNLFGGVAVNAARGIAYQVMSTVYQFVSDISISFQPKTMMNYVTDKAEAIRLFYFNSRLSFAICFLLALPMCMYTESILQLWLGHVPQFTVVFVQCIMLYLLIRSIHGAIDIIFKSSGNIKNYQLIEFSLRILAVPLAYILLHLGFPYYWAFMGMCILEVVNLISIVTLAHYQIGFDIKSYIVHLVLPLSIVLGLGTVVFAYKTHLTLLPGTIGGLALNVLILEAIAVPLLFFILLKKNERHNVIQAVLRLLSKKRITK